MAQSKSITRELAMQILYSHACGGECSAAEAWNMTYPEEKVDKRSLRTADALARDCLEMQSALDDIISPLLHNWTLDRIDLVDLAILRLACYEMLYYEQTPVPVAINEAVELAKIFSTDNSYAFVNGVLGTLAKNGVPEEESHEIASSNVDSE